MKTLYLDCGMGAAGDMLTAALSELFPDPDALKQRIRARTRAMLAAGWIDEARRAIAAGLLESPTAHQALGYRLIGDMLAGRLPEAELEEKISTATWQFARRQRTWFRHQEPASEMIEGELSEAEILEKISKRVYINIDKL